MLKKLVTKPSERLRQVIGRAEAVLLILLGGAVLYFSIAGQYQLLMNVKFKFLSISGGALLLVMGLALLLSRQRGSAQGVGAFALLIAIVLVGKPHVANESSKLNIPPDLDIGLPVQVDESRFARMNLPSVYTARQPPGGGLVTLGAVKRLPELDARGGFALMGSLMVCCAADMVGIGFYVPVASPAEYHDGDLLIVCGKLERSDAPIELENFRFGNAVLSVVHEDYYLRPELILPYDQRAAMPSIAELLSSERTEIFRGELIRNGLWEALDDAGEMTVFAPVDQAFESWNQMGITDDNEDRLLEVLSDHIVRGKFLARDLYELHELETFGQKKIGVSVVNGRLEIEGARLLLADQEARNGVVHIVHPLILREAPVTASDR